MRLKDFDYYLPKNLIAQHPTKPRDQSRLLIVALQSGATNGAHPKSFRRGATNAAHANKIFKESRGIEHKRFYNIVDYLNKGDILVLNNSKVMPARLIGRKAETGGKIEVFLLGLRRRCPTPSRVSDTLRSEMWLCLLGGRRRKEKLKIFFGQGLEAEVLKNNHDGTWDVAFNKKGKRMMAAVKKIGRVPLPPYIKRTNPSTSLRFAQDRQNYQTVYADEKKLGSVAAPTAGLHFTPRLLRKLKKKGIKIVYITLHVGLGTFAPVKDENIKKHKMHAEWFEIKRNTIEKIIRAKKEGKRAIAVGTTSARALETIWGYFKIENQSRALGTKIKNYEGWTDIFIYPGYKFKAIDALITNFHLPKSTLLMLVSAFAQKATADKSAFVSPAEAKAKAGGIDFIKEVYREAIKKKYRFYSYGDAMLVY